MDALAMQLVLGRARGLSAQQLRTAVAQLGNTDGIDGIAAVQGLIGLQPALLRNAGVPPAASAWLQAPDLALLDADRNWIARERITLIDALSASYPPQLARTANAPALLYVRGDASNLLAPQLAIVGSRKPTTPGRLTAEHFALCLARSGLTITSGLALGIDAAGHQGALAAGGRTVAVIASGLDQIYPRQHGLLAARIAAQGAVVSQFPRGTPPLREHFPHRNGVISGLSLGTLVVEAAQHSGSLTTARLALQSGRLVFAIPGSIRNPLTRGCHALIRAGARLVESPQDILQDINISNSKQQDMARDTALIGRAPGTPKGDPGLDPQLDKGHKILLDALGFEAASVDALVERTGLPSHAVASMLLILELKGAVGAEAGGRYVRL
jgi:DNA processing protein